MEEDEANEYEHMHIRKGGEEKERRGKGEKNRSGTKKKQKRWRKAVRSKS